MQHATSPLIKKTQRNRGSSTLVMFTFAEFPFMDLNGEQEMQSRALVCMCLFFLIGVSFKRLLSRVSVDMSGLQPIF